MALRKILPCSVVLTLALAAAPAPTAAAAHATGSVTAAAPAVATTGFRYVDIRSHDGVVLKGNLIAPSTPGPHPAGVFISSWGLNDAQYLAQAKILAEAGYVVLSYTARGFWASGGRVETAGPPDIADVSAVIDWLTAHSTADPARVGLGGVSYGAGIGLIAAGHDPRIRAVVALSAWTDLIESLYGNDTRHPQAVWLLYTTARLFGRTSAEFDRIYDDYFADRNVDRLVEWGTRRSAATYLDGINAHRPAVLIANAYGDSVFSPNQLVDFFDRLAGPRRLEFAPGDHAIPEATGLVGLPNHVWTSARRWFDEHLRGVDTGIADEPVVLRVRNTSGTVETYADWADVTGSTTRYLLGDVPWYDRTGPLTTAAGGSGWKQTFRATGETVAQAGVVLLSNGLEALTGTPSTAWLPAVDRTRGAVWQTGPLPHGAAVRGIPRLHLTLRPGTATGTVVAYLYDVDASGTGRLVTHVPYTWKGAARGAALALDVALPATAWDVPGGHRLALVVDAQDALYLDANPFGASVSVSGPSWVDIPLR